MWRQLIETALQRKTENIAPQLAGEWQRATLNDTPYPLMMLTILLMRIRSDHDVNEVRVAMIKIVLVRNFDMEKEAPVALDPNNDDLGYLLGRLFALLEQIQSLGLRSENASIKNSYYGVASATPPMVPSRSVLEFADAAPSGMMPSDQAARSMD